MIVWLASYPRSGNTYVRTMLRHAFGIWSYSIYDDPNDIGASRATANVVGHRRLPSGFDETTARQSSDTFFIKTHQQWLPHRKNDTVIYIYRDGRDAIVSQHQYMKDFEPDVLSIGQLVDGQAFCGGWGEHVASWDNANNAKSISIKFEDLVASPENQVSRIGELIGRQRLKNDVPKFSELRQIDSRFFRTGRSGNYKTQMPERDEQRFRNRYLPLLVRFGYERITVAASASTGS